MCPAWRGEGGEGGGKSTIPSALVEGGELVSAHGLWREDVRRGSGCRAVEKENRSHLHGPVE